MPEIWKSGGGVQIINGDRSRFQLEPNPDAVDELNRLVQLGGKERVTINIVGNINHIRTVADEPGFRQTYKYYAGMEGNGRLALSARFDRETGSVDVDIYVRDPSTLIYEVVENGTLYRLNHVDRLLVWLFILNIGWSLDQPVVPDTIEGMDRVDWGNRNIIERHWFFIPNLVDS